MREQASFEGGVFSSAIEGGRAAARLALAHDAVLATTRDGDEFRIAYADCQLELGGASGKMWFCRSSDRSLTLFTEAPGFAHALREQARQLAPKLDQIELALSARRKRASALWLGFALLLLALLGAGYFAVRHAGRAAVALVPLSVDEKLGELALDNMSLGGRTVNDPVLATGLAEILDRLTTTLPGAAKHERKFQLRVVDAPILNAFALPGGFIVVYTGLLRAVERPEQLAGVLAHEIAHVTRRHGMHRIAQSVGVVAMVQLLFGDVSGIAAIAVELLREGAINSYSRDQEREADLDGVQTLARAALDPRALADFFALLEKGDSGLPSAVAWLGTHPELGERIATVRREAARLEVEPRPFALDWPALQRAAGSSLPSSPAAP